MRQLYLLRLVAMGLVAAASAVPAHSADPLEAEAVEFKSEEAEAASPTDPKLAHFRANIAPLAYLDRRGRYQLHQNFTYAAVIFPDQPDWSFLVDGHEGQPITREVWVVKRDWIRKDLDQLPALIMPCYTASSRTCVPLGTIAIKPLKEQEAELEAYLKAHGLALETKGLGVWCVRYDRDSKFDSLSQAVLALFKFAEWVEPDVAVTPSL